MLANLQEAAAANLSPSVRVIAAVDYNASLKKPGSTDKYPTGTHIYEIIGNGQMRIIETYPEQNFDDPEVLITHTKRVFSHYPSKKKGLILWNHGGSWDNGYGGDTQDGTAIPDGLSVGAIRVALEKTLADLRISRFDFLAFDTCLMGNIETAYELKHLTKTYIASAEIDFGPGWNYTHTFNIMSAYPTADFKTLAADYIVGWDTHHLDGNYESEVHLRTQAVFDTDKLNEVRDAFKQFVVNLNASSAGLSFFTQRLMRTNPSYGLSVDFRLAYPTSYRDMGHFLKLAATSGDATLNTSAQRVLTGISSAIVASTLGESRKNVQVGLSMEGSIGEAWSAQKRSLYSYTKWESETSWSRVLTAIKASSKTDPAPPTVNTSIINDVNPDASNPPKITFTVADADADQAWVALWALTPDNKNMDYYGVIGQAFVDNGSTYNYEWKGKRYQISNGTDTSLAAVEILSNPGEMPGGQTVSGFYKIRGNLRDGLNTVVAEAFLIGSLDQNYMETIVMTSPYDDATSSHSIAELAEQELTFTPTVVRYPISGSAPQWVEQTTIPLTPGLTRITLSEVAVPIGTYPLITHIRDLWGKEGQSRHDVSVGAPF